VQIKVLATQGVAVLNTDMEVVIGNFAKFALLNAQVVHLETLVLPVILVSNLKVFLVRLYA
jgi:hypothetical protein